MDTKEEEEKVVVEEVIVPAGLKQILDSGAHIGRKKSVGHPKMKPYIYATRQNIHILNVEKISEKLDEASEFLRGIASKGGNILFVSVSMPAKEIVRKTAEDLKMPYVFDRWIGGTLTNFKIISKRIDYFLKQQDRKLKGEFEKYTKKEQLDMNEEIKNLEKKIGGIKDLKGHPDVIVVIDSQEHDITVKEAKIAGIPVVSISSTHVDPSATDYIVPANDKSIRSVSFIMDYIKKSIEAGISEKDK